MAYNMSGCCGEKSNINVWNPVTNLRHNKVYVLKICLSQSFNSNFIILCTNYLIKLFYTLVKNINFLKVSVLICKNVMLFFYLLIWLGKIGKWLLINIKKKWVLPVEISFPLRTPHIFMENKKNVCRHSPQWR